MSPRDPWGVAFHDVDVLAGDADETTQAELAIEHLVG